MNIRLAEENDIPAVKLLIDRNFDEVMIKYHRNAVGFYKKMGFAIDKDQPDEADEITWMTLSL